MMNGAFAQNHFGIPAYNANINAISLNISRDSLQKYDKQLSGVIPVNPTGVLDTLLHRRSGTTKFRTAADFIAMQFRTLGLNPVLENNVSPWGKTNVIGTLPGIREEYVVVCGHFDSANNQCPGADDNGSGTSAVLEIARILSRYRFTYSIKFIAFGGEEQGLLGSKEYVQRHAGDSIRAVLNCDMILWDGDGDNVLQLHAVNNANGQYSLDLARFIARVDTVYGTAINPSIINPGIRASDHASFWDGKYSSVCIIEEYGSDFCPYYHTANDAWTNYQSGNHQNYFLATTRFTAVSAAQLAGMLGPVPVELVLFHAALQGNGVSLHWTTASEENNYGFTIERRCDGEMDFQSIGFVLGNGTTKFQKEYSFYDGGIFSGITHYRLKQMDNDGAISYSPVAEVFTAPMPAHAILYQNYPNPFSTYSSTGTTISFRVRERHHVRLRIFDLLGREIASLLNASVQAGEYHIPFFPKDVPSGMYFYSLAVDGKEETIRKMVVAK